MVPGAGHSQTDSSHLPLPAGGVSVAVVFCDLAAGAQERAAGLAEREVANQELPVPYPYRGRAAGLGLSREGGGEIGQSASTPASGDYLRQSFRRFTQFTDRRGQRHFSRARDLDARYQCHPVGWYNRVLVAGYERHQPGSRGPDDLAKLAGAHRRGFRCRGLEQSIPVLQFQSWPGQGRLCHKRADCPEDQPQQQLPRVRRHQ